MPNVGLVGRGRILLKLPVNMMLRLSGNMLDILTLPVGHIVMNTWFIRSSNTCNIRLFIFFVWKNRDGGRRHFRRVRAPPKHGTRYFFEEDPVIITGGEGMTLLLLAAVVARFGQNRLILAAPKKRTIEVLLLVSVGRGGAGVWDGASAAPINKCSMVPLGG